MVQITIQNSAEIFIISLDITGGFKLSEGNKLDV
jgi:hypothetical protein